MPKYIFFFLAIVTLTTQAHGDWKPLAPGMELGTFTVKKPGYIGNSQIFLLRIDTDHWDLEVVGRSWPGETEQLTAKQWCGKHKFVATINAGMYGTDYKTHLGYLRSGGHVNNRRINKYQSVAAFDPRAGRDLSEFRIFDLDAPGVTMKNILRDYSSVVQNLRLIKRPGKNRWRKKKQSWNEAALGEDSSGRVLFIFSPSKFTMHDLNNELLSMGIGIVAAQHLDGGQVAQLYLHVGDVELTLVGSHESSIANTDMPIPHVIGVRPKAKAN